MKKPHTVRDDKIWRTNKQILGTMLIYSVGDLSKGS